MVHLLAVTAITAAVHSTFHTRTLDTHPFQTLTSSGCLREASTQALVLLLHLRRGQLVVEMASRERRHRVLAHTRRDFQLHPTVMVTLAFIFSMERRYSADMERLSLECCFLHHA